MKTSSKYDIKYDAYKKDVESAVCDLLKEYGKNTYIWFSVFFSQKPGNPLCTDFMKIKDVLSPGIVNCLDEFKEKVYERGFSIHEKRKP